MIKRNMILFLLLLGIAAAIGIWQGAGRARIPLTGVSDIVYGEDCLYVLDNDGTNYDILKLTQDGKIVEKISIPKLSGVWWSTYTHLWESEDGGLYIHQYKISMEEDKSASTVYRCNFSEGILEPVWNLGEKKPIQCQILNGELYYAKPLGNDEGTLFVKQDSEGRETVLHETDFPYSHMISACYEPSLGIFWSDYNGRLYQDGREIPGTDRFLSNDKAHICMGDGRIVYTKTADQTVEAFDCATQERTVLFSTSVVELQTFGLEYTDVLPLHYGADYWCAALDLTGNKRIAAVFDYEGRNRLMLPSVAYPAQEQWINGIKASLFVLAAGLCLIAAADLYLKWTGGILSILMKLFLGLMPVILAGGLMLTDWLLKTFTEYSITSGYDLLYALADSRLSQINPADLLSVNLSSIPGDPAYGRIFGGTDYSQLPRRLYTIGDSEGEPVISKTYQWVYLWDGESLRYMAVDDNYYGARVDYYRDRDQMELMYKAMRDSVTVKTRYNDQEGNWVALYVPITGENGESIGVMESGMSTGALLYAGRQQKKRIQSRMIGLFALLTLILAVILRVALHSLARLRDAVDELASGNYSVAVTVRGTDEVSAISGAFNRMAGEISKQVSYIGACLSGYEKFIPQRVFQILEREDITKLELGDHREITASVLAADSPSFSEASRNMDGETIYARLNGWMGILIPAVAEHGGIVDHMLTAGALAYFPDEPESSLRAALAICERINRQSLGEESFPECCLPGIGIARGPVRIGIVGQRERAMVKTMSESVTLAGYLSSLAVKYGARVLVTGTAAREIPDFSRRYHVRMIGYLRLERSDQMETLYDAYDGDQPEVFRKKQENSAVFQAGLEDFARGNYYDARQKFALVLRADKTDLAARAYVYRCDTYYQMEDKSQAEIYLERY